MAEGTHVPGVMVSSTCYDLRQIREDLRRFLQDDLGYRPLLSEHPSFPLNPDANTVENCRERVERDADVLVLVIGGRYGTVDDYTSKSVTNLEYLGARQKGIPIYVFVEQGILPLLPVWKSNPTADFAKQVDTPKLFEFVEQLRSADKVWTQEFKHAKDIIDALRIQFAYQHREGLLLRRRVRQAGNQDWLRDLHGQTLRIALEKQPGWEYRLFAHALIDATDHHYRQRHRHETGIPLGLGEDVKSPVDWLAARFSDAQRMAGGLSALMSGPLQDALGPPGTPGDAAARDRLTESCPESPYRRAAPRPPCSTCRKAPVPPPSSPRPISSRQGAPERCVRRRRHFIAASGPWCGRRASRMTPGASSR